MGRPLQGWKPYGNWANTTGGVEEEFVLDTNMRLHNTANPNSTNLSVVDGINQLRNLLRFPTSSIRLVGVSGVGKTRLLQALFDERIGKGALNKSQVFYTDIGDSPNPAPCIFAENLIAYQKPTILAIDNCPPDLHRRLNSICSVAGSTISLITVEYDVKDDLPDETEVFRLEPASKELIEKVLRLRYHYVSEVDARTIAEFSGGNARIAIALANTMRQGDSLGNLRDEELFSRLFHQRNEINRALLNVAEVCSLVYSFNCGTGEGADLELRLLASLTGMSVREVYENVNELKLRDLMQQRGKWRAVLPQAIANRLAKKAFEKIPIAQICNVFEQGGSDRLLKSFSRRLSYLHECEGAIEVSKRWLSKEFLGNISQLNVLGVDLFENIAPLNPEMIISCIEKVTNTADSDIFFSRQNTHFRKFTRLLRAIAYDKELFDRSCRLLCLFALSEKPDENNDSIRHILKSLFYIRYSGTHATSKQRLGIIMELVESDNDIKVNLGISLLGTTLDTIHYGAFDRFEFGARSRDYGAAPQNKKEFVQWFSLSIEYTVKLAISDRPIASFARALLAEKFRGLWTNAHVYSQLESALKTISSKYIWNEGWLAVRTTKKFDGKEMEANILSKLNELDILLSPKSLIERAKLYAFFGHNYALDAVDTVDTQENDMDEYQKVEEITRSLGSQVAASEKVFYEILPGILSNTGDRLYVFGQGLADGCVSHKKMWQDFCAQLSLLEESTRNYQVLRGFLDVVSKKNVHLFEELLDQAVNDKNLATAYPYLQTVVINTRGVKRIKKSLYLGIAPIYQYSYLAWGNVHKSINVKDLCELLELISSKTKGIDVAVEILYMRLHGQSKVEGISTDLILTGKNLLLKYPFPKTDNRVDRNDYKLGAIIRTCLLGKTATETARILCNRLIQVLVNNDINFYDYPQVIDALSQNQPLAVLDTFLSEANKVNYRSYRDLLGNGGLPLSKIGDELIINWCETSPATRYLSIASALTPYQKGKDHPFEWTPLASKIISLSPDPIAILKVLKSTFRPTVWSGSRADIMQNCIQLLTELKMHDNPLIAQWASKEEALFAEATRSEREWESKMENTENECFEY